MECFGEILDMVRRQTPVVHSITNYVTVNDCANMILAAGGSPIMADDAAEVEQIVALSSALVLNIGTLNARTVESMLVAGRRANALNIPVVLDPVGAGASDLRNETLRRLLQEVRFAVIKGNSSEIRFLAGEKATARGVDADQGALVSEDNLAPAARMAADLSAATGAVVIVSGRIDIVAHAQKAWAVSNGDPLMTRITGSGCMTAVVVGCCVAAAPAELPQACLCAVCAMGVAGEIASENMAAVGGGTGTYRTMLLDAMSTLDGPAITCRANVKHIL
ncbi:hydroxyethylthiazole kinase [Desulfovibrio sp.]|uniref:hydroxyethylthiazole kinase n=1 Tax=Desulfovibrio sp. TaxID=885 RepID=UPI0035B3E24E